jgi:1-acyl-sn-glycerol-3-phosphate acyltransferase
MAYNLWRENNLSVPVTPLAIFGTQTPWPIPARIKVNVGEPMFISDYVSESAEESIDNFRNALEVRVKRLFLDLIRT